MWYACVDIDDWKFRHVKLLRRRRTHRDSRMPSEHFLERSFYIWQATPIGKGRQLIVANDGIDLSLSLSLYFRVKDHGQKEAVNQRSGLRQFIVPKIKTHQTRVRSS